MNKISPELYLSTALSIYVLSKNPSMMVSSCTRFQTRPKSLLGLVSPSCHVPQRDTRAPVAELTIKNILTQLTLYSGGNGERLTPEKHDCVNILDAKLSYICM